MNTRRKRGHVVTLCLLFVAMLVILYQPIAQTWLATSDSHERDLQGKRAVVQALSYEELVAEVEDFRVQGNRVIGSNDFVAYFAFLTKGEELKIAAEFLVADGDSRAMRVQGQLPMLIQNVVSGHQTGFLSQANVGDVMRSSEFIAAQSSGDVLRQRIAAATPPGMFSAEQVLWTWLLAFIFCLPFSIFAVAIHLHLRTGESFGLVIAAFFSGYRPLLSALTGPLNFAVTPILFADKDLAVDMRQVSYLLISFLSIFIGGGISTVKAQTIPSPTPAGKSKKSEEKRTQFDVIQRVEIENRSLSSVTIVDVTDTRSGNFLEGIVSKSAKSFSFYALAGRKFFSRGTATSESSWSFSALSGVRFVNPRGKPSFVSAVLAARAKLRRGRFSFTIPFASVEPCLTENCRLSSLTLLKPSFAATKKFSFSVEQFVRMTRGSKPASSTTLLGSFKVNDTFSFEGGPIFNPKGFGGFRLQVSTSF